MHVTARKEYCRVCGSGLEYLTSAVDAACASCGGAVRSRIRCPQGHVVCDACHGREARRVVEGMVHAETGKDAGGIAERMMAHPAVPMLGCEHAFIAAGALLAALRNSPYGRSAAQDQREVFERTEQQAHGGYCGLTGVCGIAPAIGAVLSVFLGSRCGADREQRIVMEGVARVSRAITDLTGPSCCKAYVRAALAAAVPFFAEQFGIVLPLQEPSPACSDHERHPHGCREKACPYYRKPSKDIFAEGRFVPGTVSCVT
jgi:hypothetical protein